MLPRHSRNRAPWYAIAAVATTLVAGASCGSKNNAGLGGTGGARPDAPSTPGTEVTVSAPAAQQAALTAVQGQLSGSESLDAATLVAQHALPFATTLGYDPSTAINLPLIQQSRLALGPSEMSILNQRGFVLSDRQVYPGFLHGYASIYAEDLPVFVSADSILFAVHKSYDQILKSLELGILIPELRAMLVGMRAQLQAGVTAALGADASADADLYLAVALSLLEGRSPGPAAKAPPAVIIELLTLATAASGTKQLELFGRRRDLDFSQFRPRGHYEGTPELERYFRAMIWLGRMDLPMLEFAQSGAATFHRQAFNAALALTSLLDVPSLAHWRRLDDTIRTFVGEPDAMEPPDLPRLAQDLGVANLAALSTLSDQQLAQALIDGGYGQQRIASQLLVGAELGTRMAIPLASTFLLLGQRYVVDSHVFSNVVYDRVNNTNPRLMPDPLDAAFAALGNDTAAPLLRDQLQKFEYAPQLERTRRLVDLHGDAFWNANLYNLWLSALRALSPTASGLATPAAAGTPSVFRTEAWARRTMNTQLASWAELRHDTILYAKQSYTSGIVCEFPDAYVEPSPSFFERLESYARTGSALVQTLDFDADPALGTEVTAYFAHLGDVASILGAMARAQQTGATPTPAHLAFVNQAVRMFHGVCGDPPNFDGWYPGLFFRRGAVAMTSEEFDPTIADVHTQPEDESGDRVGRVLHVGTGYPRLMVLTVENCGGPRAYVGLASSYHEVVTDKFKRLTDHEWRARLEETNRPGPVPWLRDVVSER